MTYEDIKQLISLSSGALTLVSSDFADTPIAALFDDVFSEAGLVISDGEVNADDDNQEIALGGRLTSSFLSVVGIGEVTISATFSMLGDSPRVVIAFAFDGWKLGHALAEGAFSDLSSSVSSGVLSRLNVPITRLVVDSALRSINITVEPDLPANLNELPQLLQGVSLTSEFPSSGFPSFETGLTIEAFELGANLQPMALSYLSATVGLAGNNAWEPLGDLLRFKALEARILVANPLAQPSAAVSVSSTVEVAGADIVAQINLPQLEFQVFLPKGETLDIITLIEDITDIPIPLDTLVCTEFNVYGQSELSTYGFSAVVETDWEIIPKLTLRELAVDFTLVTKPERETGGGFTGKVSFGEAEFEVGATNEVGATGWQFNGGLAADTTLTVADFITDLLTVFGLSSAGAVTTVTDILGGLTITQLDVSFDTQTKDFSFLCAMEFSVDDEPSDLQLQISVQNTTAGHTISFGGLLIVGPRQLALTFDSTSSGADSTRTLVGEFTNPEGEDIDLVTELVDLVSNSSPLDLSIPNLELTTLTVYQLRLSYEREKSGATVTTRYGIVGDFGWKPQLTLSGNALSPFEVRAQVALSKQSGADQKLTGTVGGAIDSTIEGLDFISLGVEYEFAKPPDQDQLRLSLSIGRVTFIADYSNSDADEVKLEFRVAIDGALTLGDVLTFLVSLVDPSIDAFELDPPWNFITDFNLASLLDKLLITLEMSKNPRKKVFEIELTELGGLVPDVLEPLIEPTKIGVSFSSDQSGKTPTKRTAITVSGKFLGDDNKELSWDPINEAPPEVPGQGASVFELRYLGLGQRVAFTQAAQVESIKEVMDLLRDSINERETALRGDRALTRRNPLDAFRDSGVIVFSPESEWLIGLDATFLKTVNVSVIFNDPVIYGLRIELTGKLAKNFAGLEFEILYTRITDTIGKYHIELTLPDFVRYFTVGAVSVTLPCLVLDIFTNGDFEVDLGFPWNFNFERSFALEVFPFTGAGGFYFNKLSAATASSTPAIPATRGNFTPVYEFGLGLRVGLGKSFRSGPLNAEISITVQGLIEGVISWYNPVSAAQSRELYYKISGGVAIVGRLYGEVDFGIISASVEVIARAMIQFVLETYKDIPVLLEAEVSVKASVKVAFIRIRFSFKMTVSQKFTIASPNGTNAPWLSE